ncbi:hypothetical protein V6N13_116014 [Hibiscus sabdariffa]
MKLYSRRHMTVESWSPEQALKAFLLIIIHFKSNWHRPKGPDSDSSSFSATVVDCVYSTHKLGFREMGKDSKPKEAKGKGKQAGGGSDESAAKGKGKAGKGDGLGTCTYVKARHILCEKQGKINEAYKKLQDGWLSNGDKVPPAEFAKIAQEYSECPSGKKGGDLGWFPRGKMAGPFQEVAFNTVIGATSAPFKSTHGYHIILCEGRKN